MSTFSFERNRMSMLARMLRVAWFLASPLLAVSLLAGCKKQKDVWINEVDVVQGVQTMTNSIPLVAYKPTFVKVAVQSNEQGHGPWTASAGLTVREISTGHTDNFTPLPFSSITVSPTGGSREKWTQSFEFWLGPMNRGDYEFKVTVNGGSPDTADDRVWTSIRTFYPDVSLYVYGLVWRGIDNSKGDGTQVSPAAPWSDFMGHRNYVVNAFPITHFSIQPLPGIGTAPPNPQTFTTLTGARSWADEELGHLGPNARLNILNNWDDLNGYAANMRSEEENHRGLGIGTTMGQEVAHTLGMWCHTFDACDGYPRKDDSIDNMDIGFDLAADAGTSTIQIVSLHGLNDPFGVNTVSARVTDIMSYQAPPNWVSSFTACQIVSVTWNPSVSAPCNPGMGPIVARGFAPRKLFEAPGESVVASLAKKWKPVLAPRVVHAAQNNETQERAFLYIGASFLRDQTVTFDPFEMIFAKRDMASVLKGDRYSIVLLDDRNQVLSSTPFTPQFADGRRGDERHFGIVIPFEAYKDKTAVILLKRGDNVLAKRVVPPRYPTVDLLWAPRTGEKLSGRRTISWRGSDPDGNSLRYGVDYSADNGETWLPVHISLTQTSVPIEFDTLPGSDQALLRVWASNSVKTSLSRTAKTFIVVRKKPFVEITAPKNNAVVDSATPLRLDGTGYSYEDGPLTSMESYSWAVDGQPIGAGSWILAPKLAPGKHSVTLTVRDSAGATSIETVSVTSVQ